MPSKNLIAALLKGHHTVAPAAMHLGPIAHHWTGGQADILAIVVIIGIIFVARLLARVFRTSGN